MPKTSPYRGVSFHKLSQQWESSITVSHQKHYLGLYATDVEAAVAYDVAAARWRGSHARLNFPETSGTNALYAAYIDAVATMRAAGTDDERAAACDVAATVHARLSDAMLNERQSVISTMHQVTSQTRSLDISADISAV